MKRSLFFGLAGLLLLVVVFRSLSGSEVKEHYDPIPPEKKAYAEFMNEYIANMPKPDPTKSKRESPDMFYEFDKLKRLDPRTGEVPADGLMRAYQDLKRQFGDQFTSRNNSLQWEERGPTNVGGRTRAIMWDPNDPQNNAAFAGGVGGGLWHTPNITVSSPTWTNVSSIFSNVAVTAIAADPNNPQIMYYGTGEGYPNADALRGAGIFKSTDGGMTWDVLPSTTNSIFYYCQKMVVYPGSGDVYAATRSGLQRSQDGGMTWENVVGAGNLASSGFISDLDIAGNNDLYASVQGGGVYKSPASLGTMVGDSGQWTRLPLNFPAGYGRIEFTVGDNNPNYMYAVSEVNQLASDVYRSTNGGSSWGITLSQPGGSNQWANNQAWYDLCITVDPFNHLRVFAGGLEQHRTTTGGNSWTNIGNFGNMHVDQHNVVFNPNVSGRLIISNDGGLYYSANNGSSYGSRNNGYNVTQFYSLAVDPRPGDPHLIGGTQDNGSEQLFQAGVGPSNGLTGADGGFCAIDYNDPDTMYTTFQYTTMLRSRDGGNNFSQITNTSLGQNDVLFINPMEMDPNNPRRLYMASDRLWRRNNAATGGTGGWSQATTGLGGQITSIAVSESSPNLVYFGASGTVYRLPDGHISNFNSQPVAVNPTTSGNGFLSCVAINPNDGNHIVIVYSSYGLVQKVMECRDADQGANATWKNLSGNLPDVPCNWVVFEPNNNNAMVLGTDLGAFRCADISQAAADIFWSPATNGLGYARIDMIRTRKSDNSIHAATHGRGMFSSYSLQNEPIAAFGLENSTTACGGIVQFIDSSANAPATWAWDFGDNTTSTMQNPVHTYATSGTYTVTLVATNANGTDSTVQNININVVPGVTAIATGTGSGCPGDTLQLNASGGVGYSWFPAAGLDDPNIANPKYVVSGSRIFTVTVTDANGCTGTDTVEITQAGTPNTWAGQDQTITGVGDSVQLAGAGATTYEWSPATGLSCTSCPDPMASPAVTTTYTVTGFNAAGCSREDMVTVFVNIVGVEDQLPDNVVIHPIYPNPVSDQLVLEYELLQAANTKVELLSMEGKVLSVIENEWQDQGEHTLRWERGYGLASGIYFVRVTADEFQSVQKVVFTN